MFIKNIYQRYISVITDILILFFLSLTPILWFPKDYLVTSHDAIYPIDVLGFFKDRLYTWHSAEQFGRDYSHSMGSIPTHAIEAGFKLFGFSLYNAEKLNFIFWFAAMGLGMYFFARSFRNIFKYRYFPLLAAILYIFNFFLLALWRLGAGTTFAVYTALPIMAVFFIKSLQGEITPFKAGVYSSLTIFFLNGGGGLGVPLYGGLIITILTAFLYFTILNLKIEKGQIILRGLKVIFITFVISLFLNAYWILPFSTFVFSHYQSGVASQGGVSGARNWTDSVSVATSALNLFRLQGFPDWYDNPAHTYSHLFLTNTFFIAFSFIFAFLAYIALWFRKDKEEEKLILFFILLSLVAIFFSAGTHKPTGILYGFFMDTIPGFAIFRSAQYKFIPALYFSFAILISYSVNILLSKVKKTDFISRLLGKFKETLIVGVTIVILISYHFPFFYTSIFVWNKPLTLLLKIPDYVFAYQDWASKNLNDDQRMLLLPRLNSSWKAEVYNWKYFSLFSLLNLLAPKPMVENLNGLEVGQYSLVNRLYDELLNNGILVPKLATMLQTSHALLRLDFLHNLSWITSESPAIYKNSFSKNNNFPMVWKKDQWEIYKLPYDNSYQKIYSLNSITKLYGNEDDVIGPLLINSNNFVLSKEIEDDHGQALIKNLPDIGQIYVLKCESCILDNELLFPGISSTNILPGSLFYFLKERKEKKLDNPLLDNKQLAINKLGFSIQRLSELNRLVQLNSKNELIHQTSQKLLDYWKFINNYLSGSKIDPVDFQFLRTIQGYVEYERSELIRSYNKEDKLSELMHQDLALLIKELDATRLIINRSIKNQDWSRVKEYVIPQNLVSGELYLDSWQLDKKVDGSIQTPMAMELGQNIIPLVIKQQGEKISLGEFNLSSFNRLRLFFPPATNLIPELSQKKEYYPSWGENCLVGEIKNYSWQKTYNIKIKTSLPPNTKGYLFVRKKKDIVFDEINDITPEYTRPPNIYTLDSRFQEEEQTFTFSGKDGDLSATVHFCVEKETEPIKFLNTIIVYTAITPTLYYLPREKPQIESAVRKVDFQKIDQTRYKITLKKENIPTVLVFNEQFNQQWKLYRSDHKDNNFGLPELVASWYKKQIFQENHFPIYSFANAWYIDKPFEGDLILEFHPQTRFYQGVVITAATILFIILGLSLSKLIRK